MKKKVYDSRRSDLAKIHIAKKQLGMNDDSYRAMLQMVAGVDSAADLNASGRRDVLVHLRKSGFKSRSNRVGKFPGKPDYKKLSVNKLPMMKKIEAYLAEAKRPWKYAHSMAKHMYQVERVQWCDSGQLRGIIVALEADAVKHGRYTGR